MLTTDTPLPMPITALAPWFGGKRTLADEIIAEAGDHQGWWEPLCGGVSILLGKPRCRQEVINDLHGDVINLAMVVASEHGWTALHEQADRTLYCRPLFDGYKSAVAAGEPAVPVSPAAVERRHIDRAMAFLALTWMGRNGAAGTARINYQFTIRYTRNGGDSAVRWRNVVDSIPAWHERLKGVVIEHTDGIALAEKIDDAPGTVIYADPPYLAEGDAYRHAFATSDGGIFGLLDDHARLAAALRAKRNCRCIVSYYDHPRLSELYPGWTKRPLRALKALAAQNRRGAGRTVAPEVLLINGPSLAKEAA